MVLCRRCAAWHECGDRRSALKTLIRFFTRLGYDADILHLEGITPPLVSVQDFFRQLRVNPISSCIEKSIGAPRRPKSFAHDDATNAAYLADIAALVTETPGWCADS